MKSNYCGSYSVRVLLFFCTVFGLAIIVESQKNTTAVPDLKIYPKVHCTRNERECPENQMCQRYSAYMCLDGPQCGPWCFSVECDDSKCSREQLCVTLWYFDDLDPTPDRCYCPDDLVPSVNGSCISGPDECEDVLKDRYCDHGCQVDTNSTITCSCPKGLTLQIQAGKFGDYGACVPEDGDFGTRKMILNGVQRDQWQSLDDTYITLNSPTAVDRVQIRPTKEKIQQIYAVTKDAEDRLQFTQFSEKGQRLTQSYPILYSLEIRDFCIDWPTGNVYYISAHEPRLTVCTIDGTACRILDASTELEDPKEIVIDSTLQYLLVTDVRSILRISLDGLKSVRLMLPSGASKLTLDYGNNYLHYLLVQDYSIYRINYTLFEKNIIPQKIMVLQNNQEVGEITAMAAIGKELYIGEYNAIRNTSYLYHINSTNPFLTSEPTLVLHGPGRLKDILVYHKSLVRLGPSPTLVHQNCHFVLQNKCVCMEGYRLIESNNSCVEVDIREDGQDILLYTSLSRRLVQGMFVPNSMSCPNYGLGNVPINPISLADYVTSNTDVHMGYDPEKNMIYISDQIVISKAAADGFGYVDRLLDTGWRARGGTIIYGLTINPSLRIMYYAEYSRISYFIVAVSLDNPGMRASYKSSPNIGHRYFSTGPVMSSYEMRIIGTKNSFPIPVIHGNSMLHSRTIDPKTGYFYDLGFPTRCRVGYTFLKPSANETSERTIVNIGLELASVSMGNASLLHFSSILRQYGIVNTTNHSNVLVCDKIGLSSVMYIRPSAKVPPRPTECDNCSALCQQNPLDSFICICGGEADNESCLYHNVKCKSDQFVCPDTSQCMDRSKLCNGVEDCEGNEDEHYYTYCPLPEETCSSSFPVKCNQTTSKLECILESWLCDGVRQCTNGEDEQHCARNCSLDMFTCPESGVCYGLNALCDGVSECPEFATEQDICSSCQSTAYKCSNSNKCVPRVNLCDGVFDCPDRSDESNCTEVALKIGCEEDEKICDSGQCIPENWWCDETFDCADRSDEKSCKKIDCTAGLIKCNSTGQCIPSSWRCDLYEDCNDGEDELNCPHKCAASEYHCADSPNNMCVSKSKLCDSSPDCFAGKDETDKCDSGACNRSPCSHQCVVHPETGAAICLCPDGMLLENETRCVTPGQTCEQWGVCSQDCTQLIDYSIKCTCHEGYHMELDYYTCKHNEQPVSLIFSNRHDLRLLPAEPGPHYSVLISSLRNTIAVDYHFEKNYVFWSDVIADKIYRGRRDPSSDSINLLDVTVVITNGLPTAEGIAVDWIDDHIYWVESGLDIIEVADLDGNNRCTIISHSEDNPMDNPRSIAVDPRFGLLFWADWGIKQIRRATMAGKDPGMLFRVNDPDYIPDGGWANGLTLDYDMKRVYWNDAKSDSIQTVDYDGKGFHMVLSKNDLLMHPFAISVFENWVYWSDWRKNSINRANKWNGTDVQIVQSTVTQPFDLKVYHAGRQPTLDQSHENVCGPDNGQCSHLCLRNQDSIQCACPHLRQLSSDGKNCDVINSFLLLASATRLTSLSLGSDGSYGVIPTVAAPLVDSVYMVDYYMVSNDSDQRLFWGDGGSGNIATASLDGSQPTNIIDLPNAVEYGFAADHIYKRLYISTFTLRSAASSGGIDICDFNGSRRSTITTGLLKPTHIALQPSNGTMFVVDEGKNAIYRMFMNGSHNSANLTPYNILENATEISNIRDIRVVLSSDNHLESQLYFGNRSHIYRYDGETIYLVTDRRVESWTVRGDELYFTSQFVNESVPSGYDVKKLSALNIDGAPIKVGAVKGYLPIHIKLVQQHQSVAGEDIVECQNCSHYCVPPMNPDTGNGTCVCYTGYKLQNNGCQAIASMLLYATNSARQKVGALELNPNGTAASSFNSLPTIQRVYKPNSVYYYSSCSEPESDYIYWIDGGHSITKSTRDLTERKTILSGLIAARDLTIDPQGGNLYWIDSFTGTVQVCRVDGSHNLILKQVDKQNDNKLVSIALHPSKGYLYYLESVHGITRIKLGNKREELAMETPPLNGGLAMAVDLVQERLLVCDGLHQIVSMDLDGSNLDVFSISLDNRNCSAIAAHDNMVYYSIPRIQYGEIYMRNVATPSDAVSLANITGAIHDIALARRDACSSLGANPCSTNNGECEALCLYNGEESSGSYCACAMGVLDSTGKKCDDLKDFVVYSKVDAIAYHSVGVEDVPSNPPYPTLSSDMTKNVIALATDPDRQRVYYSDIQRRTLSWASYNGTQTEDIILNMDSVEGLAYGDDHLYFTYQSRSGPVIQYIDLSAKELKSQVLISLNPLDAPRAIAVHSCSGLLFWTNWNEAMPSIQRAETSGAHLTSIVTEHIAIPNGLAIDHKMEKLFWADANLDKIEMCDFLGAECVVVLEQASPHIFAMAIHGDYLYWTDWLQRAVKMAHKLYGMFNQTLVAQLPRQPMGIAIASQTTCKMSRCYNSNCEQTCSVIGNGVGHACGCFDGYVDDPVKAGACKLVEGCQDNTAFACQGDCIPWELTCDGVNHCTSPDGSHISADEDSLFCATRKCPEDKYLTCLNQRCVPRSAVCNGYDDCGDLSDEFNCIDTCDPLTQFKCANDHCIPRVNVCDGLPHCWDKSDELPPNCNSTDATQIDCSEFNNPFYGHFKNGSKCPNTPVCIIEEWKCDGHNDCWDNSDEVDCDMPNNCNQEEEWQCSGVDSQVSNLRQCIIKDWRCDGDMDCNDGSDEDCGVIFCPEGEFTCTNAICIPDAWKCDGKRDCSDNSDEEHCEDVEPPACNEMEFVCRDGKSCVHLAFLCDGEFDCIDGSDETPEMGCSPHTCTEDEYGCANGRCIPNSFVCDRVDDCMDGSDELSVCSYEICDPITQFTCADQSCVPMSAHCNQWPDCPDGSDESPSTCPKPANSSCPKGQWKCSQANCIAESRLCDGTSDCDFEDELACNLNECMEHNGGCNQLCVDEKIHFHCGCHQGYKLLSDNRTCIDIDECMTEDVCTQRCLNTPGRYLCGCAPGYSLREDKTSCKPLSGDPAYLLVANRYYIRNISLQIDQLTNESYQQLVSKDVANAVGLDYDWREQRIYWTDVTIDEHNISKMNMDGTGKEILHSVTLKHPDGLAVDWIARNLYWSDNMLNSIQVSRLDGKYRKVILNGISEPRSLQLLPAKGYLFYTDWGQGAHVGRVGMDGTGHKRIITEGLGWPNALAVDPYSDKLFFGDAKLDYIAMTDLDGNNKKMILNQGVDHIFSLSVYDKWLYWSDWGGKQIHRVHKYTGQYMDTIATLIHRPMEIRIVHELNQMYKGVDPCAALNCSKLCLLKPVEGASSLQAVCACPEYYYLHSDNRTCHSNCSDISRFQCSSDTQCLHFTQICDGHQDCADGSDEKDCGAELSPCKPFQFNCNSVADNSSAECVDADKLCDGSIQCSNGEDEKIFGSCSHYSCLSDYYYNCYNRTTYVCLIADIICNDQPAYTCPTFDPSYCPKGGCSETQFQCNDTGKCIPSVYHCDGEDDCNDGSDETNSTCSANIQCAPNYSRCGDSGQCIPDSWLCDGDKDCMKGQDEDPSICEDTSCPAEYFQCSDKKCIPTRWLCDYEPDCMDGADELNCPGRPCSESEMLCVEDGMCIHISKRCDDHTDCSDGSDELGCSYTINCGADLFKCAHSSQCIPKSWRCDGTPDCPHYSDEDGCSDRVCKSSEFQCDNSMCISAAFKCDGQNDCLDGSDESEDLCVTNQCLTDRFRCGNSKCVPVAMLCDDKDDCGDGSDENPKNCLSKCGQGCYSCPGGGGYIPAEKICDGKVDCPSVTKAVLRGCINEGCPMENDERNSKCVIRRAVGGCANVRSSLFFIRSIQRGNVMNSKCTSRIKCDDVGMSLVNITCEKGYEVDVKYALDHCRVCRDKNECLEYGSCSQLCINTVGGHNCSCQHGFVQTASRHPGLSHDCVLDSKATPPYLLVADGQSLQSYDMARESDDRPSFRSSSNSRIDSLVVDLSGDQWSAFVLSYHTKSLLRADITSLKQDSLRNSGLSKRQTSSGVHSTAQFKVIWGNLEDPKSLTFDWVHGNLYWVDSITAAITLLNVQQSLKVTIVTPQSMLTALNDRHFNPQYITIDPTLSLRIFWTDCCVKSRIWSADLDGSEPRMLTDRLEWPAGITCDIANQRLYWTDSKSRTISTMTVGGEDLRTIHTFTDMRPNMIDVFGRQLMVTSFNRSTVVTLDKLSGLTNSTHSTNVSAIVSSEAMHISDLCIIHSTKQLRPTTEPQCSCGANTIALEQGLHENQKRCACLCADDYTRINVTDCTFCPCKNNGTCTNKPHQPVKCLCPAGYAGLRCEMHLCKDYCSGAAQCDVFDGKPYCLCPAHLSGARCEISKCKGFKCQNNGTCHVDNGGLPYCMCTSRWTGATCEQPITDMCKEHCDTRALSCVSNSNYYNCSCLPKYTGVDCHTCSMQNGSYLYGCHGRGICEYNSNNQPYCRCTVGQFDSHSRCLNSICKDKCLNGGACSVTEGGDTMCACPVYFAGDRCQLRMNCVIGYCKNGATCFESEVIGTQPVQCECTHQYTGPTCEIPCKPSCDNGKLCTLVSSQSTCVCPEGLQGDACQHLTSCNNHCLNGGTCMGCQSESESCSSCCKCGCTDGWTGDRCETSITTESKPSKAAPSGVIAGVCVGLLSALLALCVVLFIIYRKRQRRRQLFEHLRLSEDRDDTMHVSNPMYQKTLQDEDLGDLDDDDFSVYSETNTSNFANPLYSGKKRLKRKGDERTLLMHQEDD